jgi:hypothetical protein
MRLSYYGQHLLVDALRGDQNVERVPKADVHSRLKKATKPTGPGEYHKTKHAAGLLATVDPALVRAAALNCRRLFEEIPSRI